MSALRNWRLWLLFSVAGIGGGISHELISPAYAATFYSATPQFGLVAYTAVTHTTAATADTIITITSPKRVVVVTNSLDKEVYLTWAGVKSFYLPALTSIALDFGTNSLQAANGIVIGVYHLGVAPTVGNIAVSAL